MADPLDELQALVLSDTAGDGRAGVLSALIAVARAAPLAARGCDAHRLPGHWRCGECATCRLRSALAALDEVLRGYVADRQKTATALHPDCHLICTAADHDPCPSIERLTAIPLPSGEPEST